ncbi:MAG: hypothetical protein JST31_11390 [Actinobacteria bacterium]|nr:hypothetical protein [Actinomycetota bacterium]
MPSASRQPPASYRRPLARAAALAACLALIAAGAAGCETTQEQAAKQQARAAHILKARAEHRRHAEHGRERRK